MTRWKRFWATWPTEAGREAYLEQVGFTSGGKTFSTEQFQSLVSHLCHLLDLQSSDRLLDLCCGNGVFTVELAKRCRSVLGVDFSAPLLAVARRDHMPSNVSYEQLDINKLDRLLPTHEKAFDKVAMSLALGYFRRKDLSPLLQKICAITTDDRIVLLSGIPDRRRKHRFFDTPGRRLLSVYYRLSGNDRVGTWWNPETVEDTCAKLGLSCRIYDEDNDLPGACWRFDAKITSRPAGSTNPPTAGRL